MFVFVCALFVWLQPTVAQQSKSQHKNLWATDKQTEEEEEKKRDFMRSH